jgi:hypothetical protein
LNRAAGSAKLRRHWVATANDGAVMTDYTTPNLPCHDFKSTLRFYARLGFIEAWRDARWMILTRGTMVLEFFEHPRLDPAKNRAGCCLRLDDLDAFYIVCKNAGVAESDMGFPRLEPPKQESWGGMIGALVDPDGTFLRLLQN